jgi:hydrogenase-4 membrane subunit HyfE
MRFRNDTELIWGIAAIILPVMIVAGILAKAMGWTP